MFVVFRTYGALYISLPTWFTPTLVQYLSLVRPTLLESDLWGETPKTYVFPTQVATFATQMLKSVGVKLTCSDIRSRVCENIGQLTNGKMRTDLQHTAAHAAETTQTVEKHYEIQNKKRREEKLLNYIEEKYLEPAEIALKQLITALQLDFPKAKHAKKRKRLVDSSIMPQPALKKVKETKVIEVARVCKNKLQSKKCFTKRGKSASFVTDTQLICDACFSSPQQSRKSVNDL